MKKKYVDIVLILLVLAVGVLVRLPLTHISSIDVTRLTDPDSFLYARKALEFYNEPISEWELFTLRSEDPLMNTINDKNDPFVTNVLPLSAALIGKVFSNISIDSIVYYLCAFVCPLSAIPVYIFVKKRTNYIGAFTAGITASVIPSYYAHTTAGFFDTDAFNMVLAITIILCHVESILCGNRQKQAGYSLLAVVALVVFAGTWEAYYVYAAIAIGITIFVTIVNKVRKFGIDMLIPNISSFAMLIFCVVTSADAAVGSLGRTISDMINGSDWPDESKHISELAVPKFFAGDINTCFNINVSGFTNWLGGLPMLFVFALSIVLLIVFYVRYRKKEAYNEQMLCSLIFVAWLFVTAPIIFFGVRFIQLVSLPLIIILGLAIGYLFEVELINETCDKYYELIVLLISVFAFGTTMKISMIFAIVLSLVLLVIGIINSPKSIKQYAVILLVVSFACPIIGELTLDKPVEFVPDDYVDAMNYIVESTDEEATIVSWWDYGYYYQYATRRHVVADGGIYDGSYFYWLANVFTTDDIDLSIAIIRMLQTGSIKAVDIAVKNSPSVEDACTILKEVMVLDDTSAFDVLISKYSFDDAVAQELVSNLHPDRTVPAYLIITKEMLPAFVAITYYGEWDFKDGNSYKMMYDANTKRYTFPEEIKNSVISNLYEEGDYYEELSLVYSNNRVWIYEVV